MTSSEEQIRHVGGDPPSPQTQQYIKSDSSYRKGWNHGYEQGFIDSSNALKIVEHRWRTYTKKLVHYLYGSLLVIAALSFWIASLVF